MNTYGALLNADSVPFMGWQINYTATDPAWGPWEAHNPYTGEIIGRSTYAALRAAIRSLGVAS